MENEQLLENVEMFHVTFEEYYKAFMEYLHGEISDNSEYQFNHPTLFNLSNKLQVEYLKLPETLQIRLQELEFDVFLHCNNLIDFYSFRIFILKKQRFNKTSTIAERVDAELNLAIMTIKEGEWSNYDKLPKRNFEFYRQSTASPKLMEELYIENDNNIRSNNQTEFRNEKQTEIEEKKGDYPNNKEFFDDVNYNLKKGEDLLHSTDSIIGKVFNIFKSLNGFSKFLE